MVDFLKFLQRYYGVAGGGAAVHPRAPPGVSLHPRLEHLPRVSPHPFLGDIQGQLIFRHFLSQQHSSTLFSHPFMPTSRITDPHPFYADPDPLFEIIVDPDQDPRFEILANPDPVLDFYLSKG